MRRGRVPADAKAMVQRGRAMSDSPEDKPKGGFSAVDAAIEFGGKVFDNAEDWNAALDHVARLLDDAAVLYERGSYGSAAFLAITALEETSKAHIGIYRKDRTEPSKGRDPLRDHKAKHSMAILPTVFMTERIMEALGQERAEALQHEAHTTSFVGARESGLYFARTNAGLVTPKEAISPLRAWEFIMLAIEAAGDALVGMTNHSFEVGEAFDALFVRLRAQRPEQPASGG